MKQHLPYFITHHFLNDSIALPILNHTASGNYIVFWWKSIALGQLFINPDEEMTEPVFYLKLTQAIEPTLAYYDAGKTSLNWQELIKNKNINAWKNYMESVFSIYTTSTPSDSVPVSVIICTHNRASHLTRCLIQLKELKHYPAEIIVIDNAPSDNSTREVVNQFNGVTYIREPRVGLDIARNTGIKSATASIIAFIDDDVVIHPLWVYQVWQTFQNSDTVAMTGLVLASQLKTEAQYIFEKYWSFNRGFTDKIYDSRYFNKHLHHGPPVWEIGAGANMAFKRSVFKTIGYFDEILDAGAAGCSGDSEIWFRLLAHGFKINYNPRAIVYHEHRKELASLKKQIFNYMRGFTTAMLLQQKQFPQANYKKHLFGMLPQHYFRMAYYGFPFYKNRNRTLWMEIKGIISGYAFYLNNKNKTTIMHGRNKDSEYPNRS